MACDPLPTQTVFDGYSIIGEWFEPEKEVGYTFAPPRGTRIHGRVRIDTGGDLFFGWWDTRDEEKGPEIMMFDFSIRTADAGDLPLGIEGEWVPFRVLEHILIIGHTELIRNG